jgi:signal transduction histidine kinase
LQAVSRRDARHARLIEGDAAKTALVHLAAHELRTPLSVSRGYLDLVTGGGLGTIPPQAADALAQVEGRLAYMDTLLTDLVEAARMQRAPSQLSRQLVDLGELAELAAERVRPVLAPDQTLVVEVPGDPVSVAGDAFRIRSILSNLMDNSVKYSPSGGEIRCTVGRERRVCRVRVSDHGVGIDPHEAAELFQPFSRLARTAGLQRSGTGLGLYLCREMARAHGGDLTASANPEGGSTFTLTLPA